MTDISNTPGILTLNSTSASPTFTLHNQIPPQTMYLKRVRVEFTSAAAALAARVIYIDLPFTSSQHLIDNIVGRFMIPIVLDNAVVTSYTCELPIYMTRSVPDNFQMFVRDQDGAVLTNLAAITLQFQFNYSHIS